MANPQEVKTRLPDVKGEGAPSLKTGLAAFNDFDRAFRD